MTSDLLPALRAVIRDRRQALGLTTVEAAARAGIAQPTWSRLESASATDPSTGTLSRIAAALGWSASRLLKEAEKIAHC